MPSNLVRQAYEAKQALHNCMLQHIALTEAEIESAEHYRDFLIGLHGKHQEELATFHQLVLEMLKGMFDGRTMEETEDVGFYHAVYADELVVLTVAQGQEYSEVRDYQPSQSTPSCSGGYQPTSGSQEHPEATDYQHQPPPPLYSDYQLTSGSQEYPEAGDYQYNDSNINMLASAAHVTQHVFTQAPQ
ncbi:hypothetical protein BDN67DRAFT_1016422 [Paxillus ammoniavirescens]|nr:hypothetical protein BDN67DRAFT_1016422 [Paxillus ammoniavirescens]